MTINFILALLCILSLDVFFGYEEVCHVLREKAAATFRQIGLSQLSGSVFYSCPIAIRFELGNPGGESYRNGRPNDAYVRLAMQRALALYKNASCIFDTLLWTTDFPQNNGKTEKELWERFCEIRNLPLPQERNLEEAIPDIEQQ